MANASSKDERVAREDFTERYSVDRTSLLDDIERRVIGDVWGANGFTTVEQADTLGAYLDLDNDSSLLDVGTGLGWPGLYLAKRSGCRVVITDLPFDGLTIARRRAGREGIDLIGATVGSARRLPFKGSVFDGVVHTDVLC